MREFIDKMREHGLVVDVEAPVSADIQAPKMAATTDKLLFFHNIEGARAVMNLTASRRALSIALGIDEKKMVKTLAGAKFDGNVKLQVRTMKPNLAAIPVMHHFPKDAEVSYFRNCIFQV
jgi:UbiD family decarboxylase